MKGKNIIVALLVSLVSVALAIGITFIVARGNSEEITLQTPDPNMTLPVSKTVAIGLPIDANITSTSLPTENCTFPIDVWVQYPGAWKIETYRIGAKTYTKKEIVEILRGNSSDVRGRLLTQIFVVVLNQQNGADVTKISTAFAEAIDWLETFPPGSTPSDGDLQKANSITSTLEGFNDGVLGPPTCAYDLTADTAVPASLSGRGATPTGTLTITSTAIRIRPTETPQPRENDDKRPSQPHPTDPPPPTSPPPTAEPPTAVPPPPVEPTQDVPTPVPTKPAEPKPTDPPSDPPPPVETEPPPPADTEPPPVDSTQPSSIGLATTLSKELHDTVYDFLTTWTFSNLLK